MGKELIEDNQDQLSGQDLAYAAAQAADDKKAIDVEIIDARSVTEVTDFVLIAGAESSAQLKAIANNIEDTLSKEGIEPLHKEGSHGGKWILLDYGDLIIHLLDSEARRYYNLEEFWSHAMFVKRDEWLKNNERQAHS